MAMKLPSITIAFQTAGIEAIGRSEKGVVALLLKGTEDSAKTYTIYDATDIPETLSAENKAYISRALIGYTKPPRYVLVYVGASTEDDLTKGLEYLETQKFDYMAGPPDISSEQAQAVATWIKNQRENNHAIYKAVLPNTAADHECIINMTTDACDMGDDDHAKLSAAQMCSRIAGLIAGTPMKIACTYAPLPELADCNRLSRADGDKAIGEGKFILIHDGQKVKVGRGINSFVTTIAGKGTAFQKIKIVECMHMMEQDIRQTAEDSYIGKYPNSYDNKCLLMTAIDGYLERLYLDELIREGWTVEINMEKTRAYLKSVGVDVSGLSDDAVRRADTGDKVFIRIKSNILDAIEEIDIDANI